MSETALISEEFHSTVLHGTQLLGPLIGLTVGKIWNKWEYERMEMCELVSRNEPNIFVYMYNFCLTIITIQR